MGWELVGNIRGKTGLQGLPGPGSAAWTAAQAVTTGSVRQAPDGSWIKSTANRTTGATFDVTEQTFWVPVLATAGTLEADALSASFDDRFGAVTEAPAAFPNGFIANGVGSQLLPDALRATDAKEGHAEGHYNKVYGWYGHAEGSGSIADGKIAHAEGNACMCAGNDSHAEGNRTVAGRRYYATAGGFPITYGSEDAGDGLGVLQYVNISQVAGDLTSAFPNPLTDNVTTRYGAGAQADVKGNIYASGFTPAVWTGAVPTTPNDLQWALHSMCVVRGPDEINIAYARIAKATYSSSTGTRVYYYGGALYASIIGIYSSYSPVVPIDGVLGGNGIHSEGFMTSAWGYGAHSEGVRTRAWNEGAHSEGEQTLALGTYSHAEGNGSAVASDLLRATDSKAGHAEGYYSKVYGWYGHSEGAGSIADGKTAHAEGNCSMCSANDSHSEGNRTVAGRRYYATAVGNTITYGSEDAGDSLGTLQYINIAATAGDVTSAFPNPLTDTVTTRYGAGAQKDTKGNIYASGYTPATWTGDVPTTPADLQWAMHSICVVRGPDEINLAYVRIAKATWNSTTGTRVYYYGAAPYASFAGIYSSYSPVVPIGGGATGALGGNGIHAEGYITSAWGYGAHSEGVGTRAWNQGAHAGGEFTTALGKSSRATGLEAVATRDYQVSRSVGKRLVAGDNQFTELSYTKECAGVGWHDMLILNGAENGKTYHWETMVIGRQTVSTSGAGALGNSFAYRFTGVGTVAAGALTVLGTITRTLIGRTSGMTGDGLTTGPRLTAETALYTGGVTPPVSAAGIIVRYDGEANTTFRITTNTRIQELG